MAISVAGWLLPLHPANQAKQQKPTHATGKTGMRAKKFMPQKYSKPMAKLPVSKVKDVN
jgi:hypothetical protein